MFGIGHPKINSFLSWPVLFRPGSQLECLVSCLEGWACAAHVQQRPEFTSNTVQCLRSSSNGQETAAQAEAGFSFPMSAWPASRDS